MPELAAAYSVGFFLCLGLTVIYVFLRKSRRRSHAAQSVQQNLAKLNLFWSDSADNVVPLLADSSQEEARRSKVTIGYLGLILSLLSWVGFFFLLIVMLSERFFARSRRERRLFGSELARDTRFDANEVRRLLTDLDVMNDSPAEAAHPI